MYNLYMKLKLLLNSIQNDEKFKSQLLRANKGDEFEKIILQKLLFDGEYFQYNSVDFKNLKSFKDVKNNILKPKTYGDGLYYHEELEEISKTNNVLVYQPFGSQSAPDILLIRWGRCLPLEIKFSKKKNKCPVWNSGYPRPEFIYLFGSYGLIDATFFKGDELTTLEQYNKLKEKIEEFKVINSYIEDIIGKNFTYYNRPMYNQKINNWEHNDRRKWEDNAIDFAEFY